MKENERAVKLFNVKRGAAGLLAGVCVIASLAACGSSKIVDEYNDYVGKVGALAADEDTIIEAYDAVTGDNYTDDYDVYEALSDEIIPKAKKFVSNLEDISTPNAELKKIHEIYISAWNDQYGAFTILLSALEAQDYAQVTSANDRLDKARKGVRDYLQALEDFRTKNKIVLVN